MLAFRDESIGAMILFVFMLLLLKYLPVHSLKGVENTRRKREWKRCIAIEIKILHIWITTWIQLRLVWWLQRIYLTHRDFSIELVWYSTLMSQINRVHNRRAVMLDGTYTFIHFYHTYMHEINIVIWYNTVYKPLLKQPFILKISMHAWVSTADTIFIPSI